MQQNATQTDTNIISGKTKENIIYFGKIRRKLISNRRKYTLWFV